MSFKYPKSGPNFAPAYQVSGVPFVTSSVPNEVPGPADNAASTPVQVSFPYVTKFVTVRNTGTNELRIGFSQDGIIEPGEKLASEDTVKDGALGRNFFLLPTGSGGASSNGNAQSIQTFDIRCKEIYFLSNVAASSSPSGAGKTTSFSLLAGLTTIEAKEFPALTGSNGFGGVG